MKNPFIIFLVCICTNLGFAQVKIGDNPQTLDSSSLLELESNSKVLVISRMSEAEILNLSPLQGAMVYNTDAACIFYYDGVNWNNLCNGGSTGSISWGAITGTLTNQADLVAEFQNYVDLTTAQSIAGEKTLTEKFTVNTGTTTDQVAEFLGRVKGEAGTAPEDFVTKAQLDASGGNGGGSTWGSITGDLTLQTDLAAEFQNYVDLTSVQSIAGEKTLTEKFTVNTGTTTDQVAEFLGRVKGEAGTAPEDFVTKSQLDASGGGGGSWGSITGTLTDQTDLAAEFQNYVDLTTPQSIAGEKTLTEKLTVDTGTTTDQIAEFLGRVKGGDGTAPEDFVTRSQLDLVAINGHIGTEGAIFFAGTNTAPTDDSENLFWDDTNKRMGIRTNAPTSPLHIEGAISKPIGQTVFLTERHHTTLISWNTWITIPTPQECPGRVYIIKVTNGATVNVSGYFNSIGEWTTQFPPGVTQLQSSGYSWEQIN